MKRFASFLRGFSPSNCKIPALTHSFAAAGFSDVKTVLSSGNVVITVAGTKRAIERTFGKGVTTCIWDTLREVCAASDSMVSAPPFAKKAAARRRRG